MQITEYTLAKPVTAPLTAALVADLHNQPRYEPILAALAARRPDLIAIPGDLIADTERSPHGLAFLERVARLAPTFYSRGNHERLCPQDRARIAATGAVLLEDAFVPFGELLIGGLSSGGHSGSHRHPWRTPPPDLAFLERFAAQPGCRLLLCHHPEYYPAYLRRTGVELIFSGHAHGGQWRVFGRGVFAPGQGLFPEYTAGVHDDRLVVSRGLSNHTPVPRIFNPPELVFVRIVPTPGATQTKG